MASSESLFSLEVAVDVVRIQTSTLCCRLPAVAFRLLDFPSLIIHHLDADEREQFRNSLFIDHGDDVPMVFEELLDRQGRFQFRKGKSCLFKFDHNLLHIHLQNTPLYVMVMDMWPEVPKLVGVCSIPLSDEINSIRDDILSQGISVPTVHSSQGCFPVYNLMGSTIGWIQMGFRLLSLGTSLIPHLPEASLLKAKCTDNRNSRAAAAETAAENENEFKVKPDYVETSQSKMSEIGQTKSKASVRIINKDTTDNESQTVLSHNDIYSIHKPSKVESAEIFSLKTDKKQAQFYQSSEKEIEVFPEAISYKKELGSNNGISIVNTHCPPPLFFNSECTGTIENRADHSTVMHQQAQQPKQFESGGRQLFGDTCRGADGDHSDSIEDFNTRLIETRYRYHEQSSHNVRKVAWKLNRSDTPSIPPTRREISDAGKQSLPARKIPEVSELQNPSKQLPVLMALLQELSIITGNSSQLPSFSTEKMSPIEKENIPPAVSLNKEIPADEMFTSPRGKHTGCRHEECTKPQKTVPSEKSWLRQQPQFVSKKTKLHFKMTHSQKLRLKKNNPELLKSLEFKEELRDKKLQKDEHIKVKKQPKKTKNLQHINAKPSYTANKNPIVCVPLRRDLEAQPPKPGFVGNFEEYHHLDQSVSPLTHHILQNRKDKDLHGSGRSTPKSIEVYIPSASLPSPYDASDEGSHQSVSDDSQHVQRQMTTPGFPPDDSQDQSKLEEKDNDTYSETSEMVKQEKDHYDNYSDSFDKGSESSVSQNKKTSSSSEKAEDSFHSFPNSENVSQAQEPDHMRDLKKSDSLNASEQSDVSARSHSSKKSGEGNWLCDKDRKSERGSDTSLSLAGSFRSTKAYHVQLPSEEKLLAHSLSDSEYSHKFDKSKRIGKGTITLHHKNQSIGKDQIVSLIPNVPPRHVGIPKPKISSISPVPQPRSHRPHIILSKPTDTNLPLSHEDEVIIPELSVDFASTPLPNARPSFPSLEGAMSGNSLDSRNEKESELRPEEDDADTDEQSQREYDYSDDFQSGGSDSFHDD